MSSYWQRHHRSVTLADVDRGVEAVKDTRRHRYPFAIVWTPIHPITWLAPFVGHMGICDSRGICLDFTGAIGVDDLAFGSPTRYITLNPKRISRKVLAAEKSDGGLRSGGAAVMSRIGRSEGDEEEEEEEDGEDGFALTDLDEDDAVVWDRAVLKASKMFETRMHCMVCGNDCHSHVAVALNLMGYGGFSWWNKVVLAAWVFFCGRHTTWGGVLATWIGPLVVAVIVIVAHL
jgi:hypothetical protein